MSRDYVLSGATYAGLPDKPSPLFPSLKDGDMFLVSSRRFWDLVYMLTETHYRERSIDKADTFIDRMAMMVMNLDEGMERFFIMRRWMSTFNFYKPFGSDDTQAVMGSYGTYNEAKAALDKVMQRAIATPMVVNISRSAEHIREHGYATRPMIGLYVPNSDGTRLFTMIGDNALMDPSVILSSKAFDTGIRETALRALNAIYRL